MKKLQKKIMILLQKVQNMDKDNTIGIVNHLKTEQQAQEYLNWLEKIQLNQIKRTEAINKVLEITRK